MLPPLLTLDDFSLLANWQPHTTGYFEGKTGEVRERNCCYTIATIELVTF